MDVLPILILAGIFLWCVYHYLFNVKPWFDNLVYGYPPTSTMMPADPHIYWKFSKFSNSILMPTNIFGPVYILRLFGCNGDFLFVLNLGLIFSAIRYFAKALAWSYYWVAVVILVNPIILSQVFYPNKEIYMIISSLFLIAYDKLNNKNLMWVGLLVALFSKLEFIAIILAWLIVRKFSVRAFYYILLACVLFLSLAYNYIPGLDGKLTVLVAAQQGGSLGTMAKLQIAAEKYHLFFLVVIPRVLNGMFGGVFDFIRDPGSLGKGYHTLISSVLFSLMFLYVGFKTQLKKIRNEHLFIGLWLLAVGTVPFALHRYLLPCYPFLYSLTFSFLSRHEMEG